MSDEDGDDFTPFASLVPEGAVPMYGFLVVAYLDADDGVIYDEYRVVGKATLRHALGTLESAKFRMACEQFDLFRDGDDG